MLTCYMINCFWSFPHLLFHNAIALPVLKFIFNLPIFYFVSLFPCLQPFLVSFLDLFFSMFYCPFPFSFLFFSFLPIFFFLQKGAFVFNGVLWGRSNCRRSKCRRSKCRRSNCRRSNCRRSKCRRSNCRRSKCWRSNCRRSKCRRSKCRRSIWRRSKCRGANVAEQLSHFAEHLSAEQSSPEHVSWNPIYNTNCMAY